MKKTIWYMHKPGEERDYAMTISPSAEWAEIQTAAGFVLYEVEVDVPTLVPTSGRLLASVQRVKLCGEDASLQGLQDAADEQRELDNEKPERPIGVLA